MNQLALQGIHKRFGSVVALTGIDLVLTSGTVLGLVGPNGAGKTTSILMLLGLLRADQGAVLIDGKPIGSDENWRKHIGVVLESTGLYPQMRLLEYLEFFGTLYGLSEKAAQVQIERVVTMLSLQPHTQKLLGTLSRGNQQRVALARALMHEPAILLLDEPTNALDPEASEAVLSTIKQEKRAGRAILFSSHRLEEVETVADSVAIIRGGKVMRTVDEPDLAGLRAAYFATAG